MFSFMKSMQTFVPILNASDVTTPENGGIVGIEKKDYIHR